MISVAVIQHNFYRETTRECLKTFLEHHSELKTDHLLVVDNGSTDNSYSESRRDFPGLDYLKLDENLSFSKVCNLLAGELQSEYLVILNNDFVFDCDVISGCFRALLKNESLVCVMPCIYEELEKRFRTHGVVDIEGIPRIQFDNSQEIRVISGTEYIYPFMFRRHLFLELGGYDENYVFSYEDVDFCFRVMNAGLEAATVTNLIIRHKQAFTRRRVHNIHSSDNRNKEYFVFKWRNYLRKNAPNL